MSSAPSPKAAALIKALQQVQALNRQGQQRKEAEQRLIQRAT